MFEKDAPAAGAPPSARATATSSGDTAPDSAVANRQMSSSSTTVSTRASSEAGLSAAARGESRGTSPQRDLDPAPPGSVDNEAPFGCCRGGDAVVAEQQYGVVCPCATSLTLSRCAQPPQRWSIAPRTRCRRAAQLVEEVWSVREFPSWGKPVCEPHGTNGWAPRPTCSSSATCRPRNRVPVRSGSAWRSRGSTLVI